MKSLLVLRLKSLGCLPCKIDGRPDEPPELHHPTSGGRRLDDNKVIPECQWHHKGTLPPGCKNSTEAEKRYGPSYAKNKNAFIARYGTEQELLEETERLLNGYEEETKEASPEG